MIINKVFKSFCFRAGPSGLELACESELLPPIEKTRDVAIQIAVRVGLQAQQDGVAQITCELELRERAQQRFWIPQYLNYRLIRKEENISN